MLFLFQINGKMNSIDIIIHIVSLDFLIPFFKINVKICKFIVMIELSVMFGIKSSYYKTLRPEAYKIYVSCNY